MQILPNDVEIVKKIKKIKKPADAVILGNVYSLALLIKSLPVRDYQINGNTNTKTRLQRKEFYAVWYMHEKTISKKCLTHE